MGVTIPGQPTASLALKRLEDDPVPFRLSEGDLLVMQGPYCSLGGGFKYFLLSRKIAHFDSYFSDGLVQPPTSSDWLSFCCHGSILQKVDPSIFMFIVCLEIIYIYIPGPSKGCQLNPNGCVMVTPFWKVQVYIWYLTQKGSFLEGKSRHFRGNLGWLNIIIWPDTLDRIFTFVVDVQPNWLM